jgi:hypothetical protein
MWRGVAWGGMGVNGAAGLACPQSKRQTTSAASRFTLPSRRSQMDAQQVVAEGRGLDRPQRFQRGPVQVVAFSITGVQNQGFGGTMKSSPAQNLGLACAMPSGR